LFSIPASTCPLPFPAKVPTAELIEAAAGGDVVIVVSPHLLDELSGVLRRDKFRRWISLEDAATFVDGIVLLARPHPDPAPAVSAICRDPKDDYLILLAEDVQAHLLVSGPVKPQLFFATAAEADLTGRRRAGAASAFLA